MIEFKYTWTITDYRSSAGQLESPIFTAGPKNEYRWFLRLQPCNELAGVYVSVYLVLGSSINHKIQVKSSLQLSFLNARGKVVEQSLGNHYFTYTVERNAHGFGQFRTIDGVDDMGIDKTLTFLYKGTIYTDGDEIKSAKEEFEIPNNLMGDAVKKLREVKSLCDVVLVLPDVELEAHKAILAAKSPVFLAMFEHDMEEKRNNRVDIKDIDREVFEEMLKFIYSDEFLYPKEMKKDLLIAANRYDVKSLKASCEKDIFDCLSFENAAETLIFADLHNAEQLKARTLDFIKIHSNEIKDTEGFEALILSHPKLTIQILKLVMSKI